MAIQAVEPAAAHQGGVGGAKLLGDLDYWGHLEVRDSVRVGQPRGDAPLLGLIQPKVRHQDGQETPVAGGLAGQGVEHPRLR